MCQDNGYVRECHEDEVMASSKSLTWHTYAQVALTNHDLTAKLTGNSRTINTQWISSPGIHQIDIRIDQFDSMTIGAVSSNFYLDVGNRIATGTNGISWGTLFLKFKEHREIYFRHNWNHPTTILNITKWVLVKCSLPKYCSEWNILF